MKINIKTQMKVLKKFGLQIVKAKNKKDLQPMLILWIEKKTNKQRTKTKER